MLTLKNLPAIGWFERAYAVQVLVEGWKSIQIRDELVSNKEQKAYSRNKADGLSRWMDELGAVVMATDWNDNYPLPSQQYEH